MPIFVLKLEQKFQEIFILGQIPITGHGPADHQHLSVEQKDTCVHKTEQQSCTSCFRAQKPFEAGFIIDFFFPNEKCSSFLWLSSLTHSSPLSQPAQELYAFVRVVHYRVQS